jgi:VWFA-related protein
MNRLVAFLTALLLGPWPGRQQTPLFHAGADAVFVDVSVMDGKRPVAALTVGDFDLLDNGVPQHIDEVTRESTSLDVSVLLDVSGSVTGALENGLLADARQVVGVLQPDDRSELITIDRTMRRTTDAHDWVTEAPPRIADGGTRLFDAIVAAAMEHEAPGRRHAIVVLTDGLDSTSVIDRATRVAVLARSNAVVHLAAISIDGRTSGFATGGAGGSAGNVRGRIDLEPEGDYDYLLREVTDATGGRFFDLRPGTPLIGALKDELDYFRAYYTIRYRPTGVPQPGWHALAVHLTHSHHDLHARSGYFGR